MGEFLSSTGCCGHAVQDSCCFSSCTPTRASGDCLDFLLFLIFSGSFAFSNHNSLFKLRLSEIYPHDFFFIKSSFLKIIFNLGPINDNVPGMVSGDIYWLYELLLQNSWASLIEEFHLRISKLGRKMKYNLLHDVQTHTLLSCVLLRLMMLIELLLFSLNFWLNLQGRGAVLEWSLKRNPHWYVCHKLINNKTH